ncbi:MAG: hypothetical protein JNG88_03825 [Phycisphaerales bacterium]|nr:hypothetical protein [Phycisphaerales bacterium]
MKWIRFTLVTCLATGFMIFVIVQFGWWQTRWLTARVSALEQERARLLSYVERLSTSRRVAQIEVLSQSTEPQGLTHTRLRWQEIAPDTLMGEPAEIVVHGSVIYIETLVLKFAYARLSGDEPEKFASLALFRRIFGDQQAPQNGVEIDRRNRPRPQDSAEAQRVDQLWRRFWEFVDNPHTAREFGVRVAQLEAPAAPMKPGEIWELSLETAGGLNLRKLANHR